MKLPLSFYQQSNVIDIAKNLLGKFLFTNIDNEICGGMIVETEAYKGTQDKACHAYKGKKTLRTAPMFENGGRCYVYLCYGMHYLLNIVTNKKEIPHAVLIRAIQPLYGIETMLKRKKRNKIDYSLTNGPGSVCKVLGITKELNYLKCNSELLWIEDKNISLKEEEIIKSPRVGIEYAQEHALLPWRFRIKDNKWINKAK